MLSESCGFLPRFVGIKLAHGLNRLRGVRAQVFFIDDAVMIDDERHHSRGTVLRGEATMAKPPIILPRTT